jgi:bifunctional polynucleotide phosphatase/kinase
MRRIVKTSELPVRLHRHGYSILNIAKMSTNPLKRSNTADRDISPPAKRKVTATTTSKAAANFFTPISQKTKEPEAVKFQIISDTLLKAQHGKPEAVVTAHPKPVRIAAFDLDDTIIATASGNRFAKDKNDWRWWHASVPAKVRQLHSEGFVIVFISNQAGISLRSDAKKPNGMISLNKWKDKVTAVLTTLGIPVTVFAATGHDLFRKPRTGMWEKLLEGYGLAEETVNREGSIFIGDAAGRAGDKSQKVKKDHSCSDRDFAANVGIGFQTPEEFFLGDETKPFERMLHPNDYLDVELTTDTEVSPLVFTKKNEVEIVLFCGSPGAGKSTFYWTFMQPLGYERVNQDLLKTRDKCVKVATQHVEDKQPVVVDNTNADKDTRAVWVGLAAKLNVPIRLVHFTAPAKLCEHNDTVRALTGDLVSCRQLVQERRARPAYRVSVLTCSRR